MVITYGAHDCAKYHRHRSTQNDPKLCYISLQLTLALFPRKNSKPVNHPRRDFRFINHALEAFMRGKQINLNETVFDKINFSNLKDMSRGTRKDKHHRDRDDSRYGSNTNLSPHGSPNISAAMSKEHS